MLTHEVLRGLKATDDGLAPLTVVLNMLLKAHESLTVNTKVFDGSAESLQKQIQRG
jgi:hypothetical protein